MSPNQVLKFSKIPLRSLYTYLFFLLMFFLIGSRDFIGLFLSKQLSYFVQVGVVILTLTAFKILLRMRPEKSTLTYTFLLSLLFLVIILISTVLTIIYNDYFPYVYILVNIFIIFLFIYFASFKILSQTSIVYCYILIFIGFISFGVAFAQQLGMPLFLEGTLINYQNGQLRPSSLTGSSLHYPLFITLLGAIVLQFGISAKKKIITALGIIFILAPFFAFSRSGILIVVASVFLIFFSGSIKLFSRFKFLFACVILFLILVSSTSSIGNRVISILNFKEDGNSDRINSWQRGITLFLDSPILIGDKVGAVTNTTKNIAKIESTVVESSVLQQLVNFGIAGTVLFYAMILFLFSKIDKKFFILRSFYLGSIFQTVFFQSIEVLPFIVLLLSFPFFSNIINNINLKDISFRSN
jgi:O-Antigen ligase